MFSHVHVNQATVCCDWIYDQTVVGINISLKFVIIE